MGRTYVEATEFGRHRGGKDAGCLQFPDVVGGELAILVVAWSPLSELRPDGPDSVDVFGACFADGREGEGFDRHLSSFDRNRGIGAKWVA